MKQVRFLATILFYLSRIAAFLFLLVGIYASLILFFTRGAQVGAWPIFIDGDHFTLYYPFSKRPFLLGDYNLKFVLSTFSIVLLYGIFLWLLSNVFKAFRQEKLFTKSNVSRLSHFYIFNLLVPVLVPGVLALGGENIRDVLVICVLHMMLGVFVFFTATIFKQGLMLQEEQDLTL